MEKLIKAYSLFKSETDKRFKHIFQNEEFVLASDASILIRTAKSNFPGEFEKFTFKDIAIEHGNSPKRIILSDTDFEKYKTDQEFEVIGEDIECKECDGQGLVVWTYKHHEADHECPVCEGDGLEQRKRSKATGRNAVPKYEYIAQIGDAKFDLYYINKVIKAAEILEQPAYVTTIPESPGSPISFKIGEHEVILMSSTSKIATTINLF